MIAELHFRVLKMGVFQSYFALLYGFIVYIYFFYKPKSCWDKMQCDVRCMERYVILNEWDSLHVDYVVSDVWNGS